MATDRIAVDLARLNEPGPILPYVRQEIAQRLTRLIDAERKSVTIAAAAKQNALHRAVRVQLDAIRTHVDLGRTDPTSDHDVEIEEAMREIARLVG